MGCQQISPQPYTEHRPKDPLCKVARLRLMSHRAAFGRLASTAKWRGVPQKYLSLEACGPFGMSASLINVAGSVGLMSRV